MSTGSRPVISAPRFEHGASVRKRAEQGLVEQLIPQMADERLGKAFCAAPARYGARPPCDRRPIARDGLAAQLGAVVADDGRGLAALAEQAIELAGDPHAGDRGVEGTRGCSRRPPPGCADPADDRENPLRGVLVKASHVQPRCGPNRLGARDRHCATSRSYRSRRSILSATRNLGSRSPARSARSARQGGRSCQRH